MDWNVKRMIMYRKILICVAAIALSAAAVSAQETSKTKFARHNRWMAGMELVKASRDDIGVGVTAVYGRQFSEIIFLGVGLGTDITFINSGKREETITDNDGNTIYRKYGKEHGFIFPLYADLQINFSRRQSPFFAEFKAGLAFDAVLTRITGTENYSTFDFGGGGVLLGSGVGKRFRLGNGGDIDVKVGVDCILGPFYANIPITLGVRYGF